MIRGRGRGLPKSNEFVICEGCNKNVAVALLSMHNCSNKNVTESNKKKPTPTAFYIYMSDFRTAYEEENPYVNLKDVPKLAGEKWKSVSEAAKKVYRDSAAQLMRRYEDNMSLESSESDEEEYETRMMMIAEVNNRRR